MFIYCPRFPIKWQHSILGFSWSCSGSMPIKLFRINHSRDAIFSIVYPLKESWIRTVSFLYLSRRVSCFPTVSLLFLHRFYLCLFMPFLLFRPEFAIPRFATVPNCNSVMIYFSSDLEREFDYVRSLIDLEYSLFVYQNGVLFFVKQIGALSQNQNTVGLRLFSMAISKKWDN